MRWIGVVTFLAVVLFIVLAGWYGAKRQGPHDHRNSDEFLRVYRIERDSHK